MDRRDRRAVRPAFAGKAGAQARRAKKHEATLTVAAAKRLLDWYKWPSNEPERLAKLLPLTVSEFIFHLRGGINFSSFFRRQLESAEFAQTQETLLGKWWHKRDDLTSADANAFLLEFAELANHAFLFQGDVSVGLTHARKDRPASDYTTAYHADRTAWTLHLSVNGMADYYAGNVIQPTDHELLLISPRASLHYKRSESTPEWQHYWALFQPGTEWLELMEWQMCAYGLYRLRIPEEHQLSTIKALFEEMVSLYECPTGMTPRLLHNLLEQVLIRANEALTSGTHRKTDARVLKACKFIEENIAESLSVAMIAGHCNVSESRLSHLFQANLNQGVKSFYDSVRVQRAKRLLATTSEPIAVIGSMVGYDDAAQFSKFFVRKLNCSPRAFRNNFAEPSRH